MKILLIEAQEEIAQRCRKTLEAKFKGAKLEHLPSVQEGFEYFENLGNGEKVDLVVCSYAAKSFTLLNAFLEAAGEALCILGLDPEKTSQSKIGLTNVVSTIENKDISTKLGLVLDQLSAAGIFKDLIASDSDFAGVKPEMLIDHGILLCDVFIRLSADRYVKVLRVMERMSVEELEGLKARKKLDTVYIKRDALEMILQAKKNELERLAKASPPAPREEVTQATTDAVESMHMLVKQVGFTPAVQELATNSVKVSLVMLGKSPTLGSILAHLKQGQGKYITSHSLTLGQLACGIACMAGWTSPSTYFKLTLAAFLHDLPLEDHDLARFKTAREVEKSGKYSEEQLNAYRFHPLKASEFAKNFTAIPPDVDIIVAQHHERPDGTGFPRGLNFNYISPLSAVFIIAHDLLHFYLENGKDADINIFLRSREVMYAKGTFRKLFKAMQGSESPATPASAPAAG